VWARSRDLGSTLAIQAYIRIAAARTDRNVEALAQELPG